MSKQNQAYNVPHIGMRLLAFNKSALSIIREQSHHIITTGKLGYERAKQDIFTNGDEKAQAMYLEAVRKEFPTFGIIAEEDNCTIPCTDPDHDIYLFIDPLCGTKAYARGQSYGVASMLALMIDEKIVVVVIGDANTDEVYYYADENTEGEVYHERFGHTTVLTPNAVPLHKQYLILRDTPRKYPRVVNEMIDACSQGNLFENIDVLGGSIGLSFASLWKGEVGGIVLKPGIETPWDSAPVVGINRRMGFKRFRIDLETNTVVEHDPKIEMEKVRHDYYELIIHRMHVPELMRWLENHT